MHRAARPGLRTLGSKGESLRRLEMEVTDQGNKAPRSKKTLDSDVLALGPSRHRFINIYAQYQKFVVVGSLSRFLANVANFSDQGKVVCSSPVIRSLGSCIARQSFIKRSHSIASAVEQWGTNDLSETSSA